MIVRDLSFVVSEGGRCKILIAGSLHKTLRLLFWKNSTVIGLSRSEIVSFDTSAPLRKHVTPMLVHVCSPTPPPRGHSLTRIKKRAHVSNEIVFSRMRVSVRPLGDVSGTTLRFQG